MDQNFKGDAVSEAIFVLVPLVQGENSPYVIPFCISSK